MAKTTNPLKQVRGLKAVKSADTAQVTELFPTTNNKDKTDSWAQLNKASGGAFHTLFQQQGAK